MRGLNIERNDKMSIADQVSRINSNISAAYQALESRGAAIPQSANSDNLRATIESIGVIEPSGRLPVDFEQLAGLIKTSDFSLYGEDSTIDYHTRIPVAPGEMYVINCYSANASYPGAFYTSNGAFVSSVYEDDDVHLDARITVPSGVDTLWLNNKTTRLPLDDWKVYRLLPVSEYCEENNSRIVQLEEDCEDLSDNLKSGDLPLRFDMHVGLLKASDFSLYGTDTLGSYHASLPVSPGEKYIISCYSSNASYPGAFFSLNGTYVSSVFTDDATHIHTEITVPSGVDTLWINNKSTRIPLDQWKVYRILPAADFCEENNEHIVSLETQREDEQLESLRRIKNLEDLFTFRWKPFDKAYYCFINDDAKKWLHVAYDVFHAHGAPLGAAVIADHIELHNDTETQYDRTIKDTLDLIVADGGEVLVHYAGNLLSTDTYETWYNKVIRDAKRVIESYGYTARGLMLADSSSRNSAIGEEICERFFDYADNVGTKPQYKIVRKQFSDNSTVADVKTYIDSTVTTPGIYPIMMHGPNSEPWATAAGLDEILTYIENSYSSAAEISTYSAVFDEFGTNGFLTLSDLPVYEGGIQ